MITSWNTIMSEFKINEELLYDILVGYSFCGELKKK